MRKFIVFEDGDMKELSPITYEEFMSLNLWVGASDIAFDNWLRHNKFHEIDSFNEETLATSHIEISLDHKINIEFEYPNYDKWVNITECKPKYKPIREQPPIMFQAYLRGKK